LGMNPMRRAVLSVACPTCGAAVGKACHETPSRGLLNTWHIARVKARPLSKVRLPGTDRVLGANPCGHCGQNRHYVCSGHHRRSHGMPGLPCTCTCKYAMAKRREN
jgi:hypothetical protein